MGWRAVGRVRLRASAGGGQMAHSEGKRVPIGDGGGFCMQTYSHDLVSAYMHASTSQHCAHFKLSGDVRVLSECLHAHMNKHAHVHTHACLRKSTHAHTDAHMPARTHSHTFTRMHARTRLHRLYTHKHAHTHIHKQINRQTNKQTNKQTSKCTTQASVGNADGEDEDAPVVANAKRPRDSDDDDDAEDNIEEVGRKDVKHICSVSSPA